MTRLVCLGEILKFLITSCVSNTVVGLMVEVIEKRYCTHEPTFIETCRHLKFHEELVSALTAYSY